MDQPDPLPDVITIGEKYRPAMEVQTPSEAQAMFARLVEHTMRITGKTQEEAERIERSNIGYFSGYYSRETADRVMRLFGAVHPIFGGPGEWPSDPQEILRLGIEAGKRSAKQ